MRKLFWLILAMVCITVCAPVCRAVEAEDISGESLVAEHSGTASVKRLFDGRYAESIRFRSGGTITLEHGQGMGSLYILFGMEYGEYTVTCNDTAQSCSFGKNGFLHEFLDLEEAFGCSPKSVTLSFENGAAELSEIYAFTSGQVPAFVQRWEQPLDGQADLVLFSTHGDDEQLFFAGMLPYYASERGYNVQVVYMTAHRNITVNRSHEMLNGLWAVGIRNYPVWGDFGDYNSQSLKEAYQTYAYKGISREDILSYVVENVRRFRPKVAVGHDLNGEYGHGMHMVYAELLCEAVDISNDPGQFSASAAEYGVWDVPKTYLHLYPENEIRMDWDIPLESFSGMTAFEVTKDLGFPCHISQQKYYSWYFTGKDSASEITQYSPCEFGLYRSLVGEDTTGKDFFENVTTHEEDFRLEQQLAEEAARQEELSKANAQTVPQTIPPETVFEEPPVQTEEHVSPPQALDLSYILPGTMVLSLTGVLIVSLNNRKKEK